jgi:hypothetical protein
LKPAEKYMSQAKQKLLEKNDEMLLAVAHAVASVQQIGYGSIEVTIHEGRITQIEKREKLRISKEKNIAK